MALTLGTDVTLGMPCPDFNLPSMEGRTPEETKFYGRDNFKDRRIMVVMFICNHCPYVKAVEDRIIELQRRYAGKSVQLVGICSNDPTDYPEDSYENLRKRWHERNYGFPYLHDESQAVAKAFGAVCTPEFFVYNQDRLLAYHGRLDDNWKEANQVTRRDLIEAINSLLAGREPDPNQVPSMGCSIKWKNV
jgi:thiol-disulfide isomerase/thioredoxin